jgi:hypothetical protein
LEGSNVRPADSRDQAGVRRPQADARTRGEGVQHPDISRAFLQANGVRKPSDAQVEKAGKRVRGIIRAHKSTLAKSDPAIKRHTRGADYGLLSKRTRDAIVKNNWKD